MVRALTPHIGAYLELAGGERLIVTAASSETGAAAPGELAADGDELVLGTADGRLRISEVRPAGRATMPAAAYLRGRGGREALPKLAGGA